MREDIPQHGAIAALAKEYRDEVRTARLAADDPRHLEANSIPGLRAVTTFAGTESCISCHKTATEIWKKTGYADAFATLTRRKADADPN